jgi:hypothetical protein
VNLVKLNANAYGLVLAKWLHQRGYCDEGVTQRQKCPEIPDSLKTRDSSGFRAEWDERKSHWYDTGYRDGVLPYQIASVDAVDLNLRVNEEPPALIPCFSIVVSQSLGQFPCPRLSSSYRVTKVTIRMLV